MSALPRILHDEAEQALPEIVTRYMSGESMQDIAPDMRRGRRTLYKWMLSGLGEDKYREVVTECLVARVADADQELEDARLSGDAIRVAAAREVCRFARMDLERRRPALYGAKHEGGGGPAVIIQVADLRGARVTLQANKTLPAPDAQ